jgi:Glu-tRNA(Gln) amidotransferase subunit E-like FAD-binding protein
MEELDYNKLKFKAGLEIHQQLNTKKLFCNCPSLLRQDEPDYLIKRKLHAVAGESGEIDIAARQEVLKNREFVYQGYDTTCLVELDEEPPHEINREALKIALQIALLFNMKIIPISQIMRKTVIDGSNTSGFQRTVLIARDGWIDINAGRVAIDELYLEEDAARIIERGEKQAIFRLDRLGIPLVEIKTGPDFKNAEQVKEGALKIGKILRSTNVKRGLGTIRQDVNISTENHPRVEIKGFQNPKIMIKTVNLEVKRQIKQGTKGKPEVRNSLRDGTTEFLRPIPGAARMYPETDLFLLKIHRDFINEVKRDLPKLKDEIEGELKERGLSEEMIRLLFKQRKVEEFKEMLEIINNPKLIAKVLLILPKEIASKEKLKLEKINKSVEDEIPNILNLVKEGKVSENQIKDVLLRLVKGKTLKEAIKFETVDINKIEEQITKIIKERPGLSEKAYMGLIMKEFHGRISGKEVMEMIKKFVGD